MTDPITPAYLDELDALSEAATEGPWEACPMDMYIFAPKGMVADDNNEHESCCGARVVRMRGVGARLNQPANLAFIAAARQAVPRLVKALREARTDVERLRDIVAIAEYSVAHFKGRAEAAEAERDFERSEKDREWLRAEQATERGDTFEERRRGLVDAAKGAIARAEAAEAEVEKLRKYPLNGLRAQGVPKVVVRALAVLVQAHIDVAEEARQ